MTAQTAFRRPLIIQVRAGGSLIISLMMEVGQMCAVTSFPPYCTLNDPRVCAGRHHFLFVTVACF